MKSTLAFILMLIVASGTSQELIDSRQREIVFRSVNIIPMDRERVIENQSVVVKNGKIIAMGDPIKIKHSKEALIVDATGKYLIPGLAEMHAHVPAIDDMEAMKEVVLLFALKGVTTIRGMLGHPKHLELRNKLQTGEILGPRFYTSGPSFSGQSIKSVAAADSLVRQQKKEGYDFLKLHPGLTKETFAAMARRARELKIPYAGHVSFDVGVWTAIDADYATIDHMDGFIEGLVPGIDTMKLQQTGLFGMFVSGLADTTKIPKLMAALKQHHIWVVPTQALAERWFAPDKDPDMLAREPEMMYMNPNMVKNWTNTKKNLMNNPSYNPSKMTAYIKLRRKLIYECNRNGIGLLLGSDAPQVFDVPGFSLHQELQYMVDAGLTPYKALRMGTVNVASFYQAKDMGTIRPGAVSDLILLNGNPLTDIRHTGNIEGVMLGNRWLSKDYIDQELKKLVKQNVMP